jgi:pimeloyl-ACP methyl ester carboxylesterase
MEQNHYYPIESGRIATIEYGDKQTADLSVVFLHGWLDNAASFSSVMEVLHQKCPHIHLCAIDLPGHGLSQHKSGSNFYQFLDYIDDVNQILAHISSSRLVIVGHSLGALIAGCYSAAFPEKVSALIQIEGHQPIAEDESNVVTRLREGIVSRQRVRNKKARMLQSEQDAIALRAQINNIRADLIAPIVRRSLCLSETGLAWRYDTKLQAQSLYRMSADQAEAFRAQIQCPHLLILGESGYSALKVHSDNQLTPPIVETVAGGHHCHLESHIRVTELIFGLLNRI